MLLSFELIGIYTKLFPKHLHPSLFTMMYNIGEIFPSFLQLAKQGFGVPGEQAKPQSSVVSTHPTEERLN